MVDFNLKDMLAPQVGAIRTILQQVDLLLGSES